MRPIADMTDDEFDRADESELIESLFEQDQSQMNLVVALENLQANNMTLIQTDWELNELLEHIGVPESDRSDITGAVVIVGDGDYDAVWLSMDGAWYALDAIYHPLPYYMDEKIGKCLITAPYYWQPTNHYYNR